MTLPWGKLLALRGEYSWPSTIMNALDIVDDEIIVSGVHQHNEEDEDREVAE